MKKGPEASKARRGCAFAKLSAAGVHILKDGPFTRLNSYVGALTPAQAAEGIAAARENAAGLFADAELLFKNARYPRACALAILAIEEAGKVSILRQIVAASSPAELARCWKDFRSHARKNAQAHFLDTVRATGKRRHEDFRLDDFAPVFAPESDHPRVYDALKQIGFYSDCLGKAHWSKPRAVLDKRTAHAMLVIARVLAKKWA